MATSRALWAAGKVAFILGLLILGVMSSRADQVIVSGYTPAAGPITANPPYGETGLWSFSSLKSSASGLDGTRQGSRWCYTNNPTVPAVTITPTLAGVGPYLVEVTHGSASSISVDVTMSISAVGATLSTNSTIAFRRTNGVNAWVTACILTNQTAGGSPAITFTYASGIINNSGTGRIYVDGVRFSFLGDPCRTGLPELTTVNGPLAADQTFVNVPAVDATATNISVYADGGLIGHRNSGIVAGVNQVTTSPLVKGQQITVSQWKNGVESCLSGSGPKVGGGANTHVRVALSLRRDATLTGPIGVNGSSASANVFFLSASGVTAGFGTAPAGGLVVYPSNSWQTLTFNAQTDREYFWAGSGVPPVQDAFAILESLAVALDDTDTGPYDIYIDDVMNGTNVIQNFESAANGASSVLFAQPSFSSTTSPYLLSPSPGTITPNVSVVTNYNAATGTQSLRITWQFKDTAVSDWVRLATLGSATLNPEVDLTQPISLRILILPVGSTIGTAFNGVVGNVTGYTRPAWATGSNTLSVTATGPATYTCQWYYTNPYYPAFDSTKTAITDATNSTLALGVLSGNDSTENGMYTVQVSDGVSIIERSVNFIVSDPAPWITNQPAHTVVNLGDSATLAVGADGHVPAGNPLTYQWYFNDTPISDGSGNGPALSLTNVQVANSGMYYVSIQNNYGTTNSMAVPLDVLPVGAVVGTGTGLRGSYFTNENYGTLTAPTNMFAHPVLARIDPTVDFDWGAGSPATQVTVDYFSVLWTGQLQIPATDTYFFYIGSDDGSRLWLDGGLVVDNWGTHPPTFVTNSLTLTSGKHDLVMEFYEKAVSASAKLGWFTTNGINPQSVWTSQLYPTISNPTLNAQLNGSNLVLNWAGPFNVLSATNVTGPWKTNFGSVSPFTNAIGAEPSRFFRLQVQ